MENQDNIHFQLTDTLIEEVKILIESKNDKQLSLLFKDYHYADIAEILDELNLEEAVYLSLIHI